MTDNTRNEEVSVGTTSTTVAELGQGGLHPRTSIIIKNTSPNNTDVITLNVGNDVATDGAGVVLNKDDTWQDAMSEGYIPYQGRIQAICKTANGKLSITER